MHVLELYGDPPVLGVHRKSIFLYLDRFVVVVGGGVEGQGTEMAACLFVSLME